VERICGEKHDMQTYSSILNNFCVVGSTKAKRGPLYNYYFCIDSNLCMCYFFVRIMLFTIVCPIAVQNKRIK